MTTTRTMTSDDQPDDLAPSVSFVAADTGPTCTACLHPQAQHDDDPAAAADAGWQYRCLAPGCICNDFAVDDDARLAYLSARNRIVLPALREIETTTAALRKQFARRAPRRSEAWVARQQRVIDEHDVVLVSLREQKGAIDAEMHAIYDRQFAAHQSNTREIMDAVVATIVVLDDMTLDLSASSDYPSIELVSTDPGQRTRVTVYGPRPKYDRSPSGASLVVASYSAPTISHPSSWSSNLVDEAARMARFLTVAVAIADAWTVELIRRGATIA